MALSEKKQKPKKTRAKKYDEKLIINGSFGELVKELAIPIKKDKKENT